MMRIRNRSRFAMALVWGVVALTVAGASGALLIGPGDAPRNDAPPADDRGWSRVATDPDCGAECEFSYVYLGNGWFASLREAATARVRLHSTDSIYEKIPDSDRKIGPARAKTGLLLFRVKDPPDLPPAVIPEKPPIVGSTVVMIGGGLSRGERDIRKGRFSGWKPAPPMRLRWGTNKVDRNRVFKQIELFTVRFDAPNGVRETPFEAHAVRGDLGGGVFAQNGDQWELVGVMALGTDAVFGGGKTYILDLTHYREEIERIVGGGR